MKVNYEMLIEPVANRSNHLRSGNEIGALRSAPHRADPFAFIRPPLTHGCIYPPLTLGFTKDVRPNLPPSDYRSNFCAVPVDIQATDAWKIVELLLQEMLSHHGNSMTE